MNITTKLLLLIICLSLNTPIGRAEIIYSSIEKVNPPVEKKKKKLFRAKKRLNPIQNNSLQQQQTIIAKTFMYIFYALGIAGLITFIVGAVLVNPLIWIIGGAAFLIGFIYWIFYSLFPVPYYDAVFSILFAILFALAGIVLLIVGLMSGTLALWVGGLIFMGPIGVWCLLLIAVLLVKLFTMNKTK